MEKLINRVRRDFREGIPTSNIIDYMKKQNEVEWTNLDFQKEVVEKVLNDPICKKYPPSSSYVMNFLRRFVQEVEFNRMEVNEDILSLCFEYLSATENQEETYYKTYHIGDDELQLITIRMAKQFNLVGLTTWEAGFFLAEFMMINSELFQNKRCLELGAGVGITAIAVMKTIPLTQLITTDYTSSILENLAYNMEINGYPTSNNNYFGEEEWEENEDVADISKFNELQEKEINEKLLIKALNWENVSEKTLERHSKLYSAIDTIIAADVLYDLGLVDLLVKVLSLLLSLPRGEGQQQRIAYITQTTRNPNTVSYFLKTISEAKLQCHEIISPSTMSQVPSLFRYNRGNMVVYKIHL